VGSSLCSGTVPSRYWREGSEGNFVAASNPATAEIRYLLKTQITPCRCTSLRRFALQHCNEPFLTFMEVSIVFTALSSFTLITLLPSLHVKLSHVSCWTFNRLLCTLNSHKFRADHSTAFTARSVVTSFMLTLAPPSLHVQLS